MMTDAEGVEFLRWCLPRLDLAWHGFRLRRIRRRVYRRIEFVEQDIRRTMPGDGFHLILCRNLVLTYFEDALQRRILARMRGEPIAVHR